MDTKQLQNLAFKTLCDLSTDEGINASGKDEIYGCIFGRDSFITILKILKAYQKANDSQRDQMAPLMQTAKTALLTLVSLQGKETNIESGEQPGKFIHEFRKTKFEHLINAPKPWFLYPEGVLKNYDSIDSTPLGLIALYRYYQLTQDGQFLLEVLPAVEAGLNWIITFGDLDKDFLIEYELHPQRKYGGLVVQSWTDSHEALTQVSGKFPKYPIAPVEAQAYAWLSLRLWANFYYPTSQEFAHKLFSFAKDMKTSFNRQFLLKDIDLYFAAQALDGDKRQIKTITANPLLCLWAAYDKNGKVESIIEDELIEQFVQRAFQDDLFVNGAGIRTMSSHSPTFNPNRDSYHNGSFWPVLNGMIVEGLENFDYRNKSEQLKNATLSPIVKFGSTIELYTSQNEEIFEFLSSTGQTGCRQQAWSAAAILELTISA